MKQVTIEAKANGQVVGTAQIEEFENAGEAVATLGEAEVVKLINYAFKIKKLNALRKGSEGSKTEKKVLREKLSMVKAKVDAGEIPQTVLDEMMKLLGCDASIFA